MNPKYLPTPIYNMVGESPWFLVTAKLLTSAQWSTSNQRELQDNCVPSSVPTPDTSLNLRSKTLKPSLTQSWSGVALLGLFHAIWCPVMFVSLWDDASLTRNPDLTPCGNSPATGNSGSFPLRKTTAVVPAHPPDFFIKGINHGFYVAEKNAAPCQYHWRSCCLSLHWCKAQLLLRKLLISLFKLGRDYVCKNFSFFFFF